MAALRLPPLCCSGWHCRPLTLPRSSLPAALRSGDGGGGIADALREVQLQVKQLLSQEDRLAAAAAAERAEEEQAAAAAGRGGAPGTLSSAADGDLDAPALAAEEGEAEEGEAGSSAAGMLQAAVALLDEAQALLDDAEDKVAQYARAYRFSQADYDELSARLQQVSS